MDEQLVNEKAVNETVEQVVEVISTYGLSVIGGIIILILGWIAARWAAGLTRRLLSRSKRIDHTLQGFFASLVRYLILAFVVIAVLNQFGVQTASLIAVLASAGIAIGLALQGTLSNVAAGIMLLIFRPLRVGQYVEVAGQSGTVKDLNLFFTELATPDNVQIIIPNSSIWGGSVVNYSHHSTRRADFNLGIGYDDDIDTAMKTIEKIIGEDSRSLDDPAPQIIVGSLGDSSVNISARIWVEAGDYWQFKWDLTKRFKEAFDKEGISIPFPQRDVHVYQFEGGKAGAKAS